MARRHPRSSPPRDGVSDLGTVPLASGDATDDDVGESKKVGFTPRWTRSLRLAFLKGRRRTLALLLLLSAIALASSLLATRAGRAAGLRSAGPGGGSPDKHDGAGEMLARALFEIPLPSSVDELDELNEELSALEPDLILRWAHNLFFGGSGGDARRSGGGMHPLVQVTSFGSTGLAILHILSGSGMLEDVPVVTMDTLHLFPESYEFYDTVRERYPSLDLAITRPSRYIYSSVDGVVPSGTMRTREEFDGHHGADLWKTNMTKFTQLTKVDPLNGYLAEHRTEMWITGRRRSTGDERSDMEVLEFEYNVQDEVDADEPFDPGKGRWKLNPMAWKTSKEVWNIIRSNRLPYNPLYDKGYTSIGDTMTTGLPDATSVVDATAVDAIERSGRFFGDLNKTECGLHSHLKRVKLKKEQALANGEEDLGPPMLDCGGCADLTAEDFESSVLEGAADAGSVLIIEFYSPWCGGCQAFAPTFRRLVEHLASERANVRAVRFDVTESDVPTVGGEEKFLVTGTPTLYRVEYPIEPGKFYPVKYNGSHDYSSILEWATARSSRRRLERSDSDEYSYTYSYSAGDSFDSDAVQD